MKWKANIIGEEHTWYSEDVVNRILDYLEHFCNKCPYADVEEDVCNNYCLLDEISKPIYKIIEEGGEIEKNA